MTEERCLEMDAATAHLDRGWDLLHRGDLAAARMSANRVLKLNPESPDAYTLLGAIAATDGEPEEALELFRQAMDLDPEHLDAFLYAADLYVHSFADFENALHLCDEAEALVSEQEETLDLLLLRAETWIAIGDLDHACQIASHLPSPPYPAAAYYLRAGRILLEVGKVGPARDLLQQALLDPDTLLDSHYYLGVALEGEGKSTEAFEHFVRVYELEKALPMPSWAFSDAEFSELVGGAIDSLPPLVFDLVKGVPVKVLDYPSLEMISEGLDPRAMVFLSGLAQTGTHRAAEASPAPQINCIFVYKRNVERFTRSKTEIAKEVGKAMGQETALFFNLASDTGAEERCLGLDS